MNNRRLLGAACAALLVVIVVTLVFAPGAWAATKYKTLYVFQGGNDGRSPQQGLTLDNAGNLYGTTLLGGGAGCGGKGCGTVFKLAPNSDGSWSESLLYIFRDNNGGPAAALILDPAGNLFGTTYGVQWAWGSVFQLEPNLDGSWTESTIWLPKTIDDGYGSNSKLTMDDGGSLYWQTEWGGGGVEAGSILRLTPNSDGSWTYSKLHTFGIGTSGDGRLPIHNGMVFDKAGNLYGATAYGGSTDSGTVFKVVAQQDGTWKEKPIYRFTGGKDGVNPVSELVFGPDGSLYGTTYRGTLTGYGMVYKMTLQPNGSWRKSTIHNFTGKDGINPDGGVVFDAAGSLYGTTYYGGDMSCNAPLGCGTVYKLTPTSNSAWKINVLHKFHDRPGSNAVGALVLDGEGNLYGSTGGDGVNTFGSVFEIAP